MEIVNELTAVIKSLEEEPTIETIDDIRKIPLKEMPTLDVYIDNAVTMMKHYIDTNWEYFKYVKSIGYTSGAYLCPGLSRYNEINRNIAVVEILKRMQNYRKLDIRRKYEVSCPHILNISWS